MLCGITVGMDQKDSFFVHNPLLLMCGADGQTVQKTAVMPQVQFLDKLYMPVVVVASGADGQTAQKILVDSTGAVLEQFVALA